MFDTGILSKDGPWHRSLLPLELSFVTRWDLRKCWFPRTCCISGKQLWFKHAYHGCRSYLNGGKPTDAKYWIAKTEFILYQLGKDQWELNNYSKN